MNWLRYLIVGIAGIWVFAIFYPKAESIYFSASLYICFIGFLGVRQQQIFKTANTSSRSATENPNFSTQKENLSEEPANVALMPNKIKYDWSSLTDAEAERIFQQLNRIMAQEKLYKNAELTLSKLAESLELKDAVLSQVINSKFNKSFYDYVNSLRVDECVKMIADEKNHNYTLLSIAFDCGFNSKSSFNRNFRKFTGKSPSDFFRKPTDLTYHKAL
ncbi:helix-turn-helix domain-containing protein [Pedobacter panaciterrae]